MANMQANKIMVKRGIAKILVQGGIHSTPEERKPEGVLQLSNNKSHSTCQKSFAEDHKSQSQATLYISI